MDQAERDLYATRALIRRALLEQVRLDGGTGGGGEPEPLAGIRAACVLRHAASRAVADFAAAARGAGKTWAEVGAAMEPAHDEYSAFLAVASHLGRGPSLAWTCGTCGGPVIDYGPDAGHPEDAERGHLPGCGRLASAVRAWEGTGG